MTYSEDDGITTAIGLFDIPIEKEMLAMMEEIRKNPQEFRFVT